MLSDPGSTEDRSQETRSGASGALTTQVTQGKYLTSLGFNEAGGEPE